MALGVISLPLTEFDVEINARCSFCVAWIMPCLCKGRSLMDIVMGVMMAVVQSNKSYSCNRRRGYWYKSGCGRRRRSSKFNSCVSHSGEDDDDIYTYSKKNCSENVRNSKLSLV